MWTTFSRRTRRWIRPSQKPRAGKPESDESHRRAAWACSPPPLEPGFVSGVGGALLPRSTLLALRRPWAVWSWRQAAHASAPICLGLDTPQPCLALPLRQLGSGCRILAGSPGAPRLA